MKTFAKAKSGMARLALTLLAIGPMAAAQTPVDDDGKVIGAYEPALAASQDATANSSEEIPLLSDTELEELVGPIALYPDDLLAIVLPASAYPLQLVEAASFLEELESDSSLKPDPEWDDSVVALLNYPEVIELLNEDLDWTWRLGEAVIAQQGDVVGAIEAFRDRAYAAGNLKTDEYQTVTRDAGVIEISPVSDDVIYVPYYEPERVVVYQPRPVYYYYPRSYPVYYYPYSSAYHFDRGYFWGVTTAFSIGWFSDSLHVYHHSYHGHPYYGRSYWDRWWYRRPSINVYNTIYSYDRNVTINRYYRGDRWRPRHDRAHYVRDDRIARSRHYKRRSDARRDNPRVRNETRRRVRTESRREPVAFRERSADQRREATRKNTRKNTRNSVRQVQPRRDRDTTANRRQASRDTERQTRSTRRTSAVERRDSVARQDRRQATTRQDRREPVARQDRRQAATRQNRRETVARVDRRQATVRQPTVRQERRQSTVRQERRAPVAQQRQERRQPAVRQQRQEPVRQSRQERPAPQRQAQRESRAEPKQAENRRSESRRNSGNRQERRSERRSERRTR